jgi:hypothetical protein
MHSHAAFRLIPLVLIAAIACLATGCMTHTTLDVRLDPGINPALKSAVAITLVTDKRVFEKKPRQASIPSLYNRQIQDTALTSRAIGRRRNTDGLALGNVFLPEGRTAVDVATEAVTKALRAKGYTVLPVGAQGAVPVEVDIQQFWVYIVPGFATQSMQFEAILILRGDGLFDARQETVHGSVVLHTASIANRAWMNTVQKGLDDLIRNMESKLRQAPDSEGRVTSSNDTIQLKSK